MGLFDFLFGKTKKKEVEVSVPKVDVLEQHYKEKELKLVNYFKDRNIEMPKYETPLEEEERLSNEGRKYKQDDKFEDLNILTSLNGGYNSIKRQPQTKKTATIQPTIQKPLSKFDFVAIDFETSNNQHSICSAAIVVVKDGVIIEEKEWLVKPSSPVFESRNISVHGISYETVKNAPMFPEVWEELKYYLENETIVGHNVLGTEIMCLKKAFEEYKIEPTPILDNYICTLSLSRTLLPNLENHKLTTVIKHLELESFNHHNALEDARACANVLLKLKTFKGSSDIIQKNKTQKSERKKSYFQGLQEKADESLINIEKIESLDLENKNIVITGTFDMYERDKLIELLEKQKANIRTGVNAKTDFLIVGHEPGPSKIQKASALKITMIDEYEITKYLQ